VIDKFQDRINIWAEREIISPAQMEKRHGKEWKKEFEPFIESKSSGTALVPVSDDRPPAKQQITAQDFPVVEGAAKPNPVLTLFN
jgi:hypothetical protein